MKLFALRIITELVYLPWGLTGLSPRATCYWLSRSWGGKKITFFKIGGINCPNKTFIMCRRITNQKFCGILVSDWHSEFLEASQDNMKSFKSNLYCIIHLLLATQEHSWSLFSVYIICTGLFIMSHLITMHQLVFQFFCFYISNIQEYYFSNFELVCECFFPWDPVMVYSYNLYCIKTFQFLESILHVTSNVAMSGKSWAAFHVVKQNDCCRKGIIVFEYKLVFSCGLDDVIGVQGKFLFFFGGGGGLRSLTHIFPPALVP